jgi:hypothetical protein
MVLASIDGPAQFRHVESPTPSKAVNGVNSQDARFAVSRRATRLEYQG